ncbi:MAG: hypothetical protein JW891_17190 [Candidatus Lokiarchaeota archaeon]|nr:hypothetical protein [Candidatus Lokiarchaeota archaeon]
MTEEMEKRIADLEQEVHDLYDDIETLQDEIMEKDTIISDLQSTKGSKKATVKALKSQIAMELEQKEKENRDLKDKLGFLRKEKIELQRKLEKHSKNSQSTVIPIIKEEKPLNSLVEDLQATIAKLRVENKQLKHQRGQSGNSNRVIAQKDKEIELLQLKITELFDKLKNDDKKTIVPSSASFTKDLTIELQEKLNKTRLQLETTKKKLAEYENKAQKAIPLDNDEIDLLKMQIESLKKELASKSAKSGETSSDNISSLMAELQEKLNNARSQINTLQNEIKILKADKDKNESKYDASFIDKLKKELKEQKDLNDQLKKKIEEQELILGVKEKRIISLSDKAKSSNKGIENGIPYDSPVALRLRELSGVIDDLKKENAQQRNELFNLRNKT